MVPRTRGSSAGRNPVVGMRSRLASKFFESYAWTKLAVEPARADLGVDALTNLAPALDGTLDLIHLDRADPAVERDPGHDLRIGEVLRLSARLPHALIRKTPHVLQVFEDGAEEGPIGGTGVQPTALALKERVHDFSEHVELELSVRRVADPNRR